MQKKIQHLTQRKQQKNRQLQRVRKLLQDETENSEYILPESDTRYVEQDEIDQLTKNEVRLAINEIYARHGRIFENSELREYFESKDWYDGTIEPEDFDEDVLNQYEKANVKLLADNK